MNRHVAPAADRRAETRAPLSCACKVLHEASGRYWYATARDVSRHGMLLGVESTRPLQPGDRVMVHVAWSPTPLLASREGVIAEVKRVMPRIDGVQYVGVRFAAALDGVSPAAAAA
ncbi:MAG: PilZ domain [Planctomycetota bacterium]